MKLTLAVALHAVSVLRGGQWVLRDISLRLRPGERWALIGGNGAGKTHLLKVIGTDVWPTPTGCEHRVYRLGSRAVDLIEAKQRIAYLGGEMQDKYARYGWNLRVRDLLATGIHRTDLLLLPVTPAQRRRVLRMLEMCGLRRLAARKFLSLSYGQQRLALLARALVQNPDWLLLDEFYNGLDADCRLRIDAILMAAGARGQSWIAAAHRPCDVPRGTRRILELEGGRLRSSRLLRRTDLARLAAGALEPPRAPAQCRLAQCRPAKGRRAARTALAAEPLVQLRDVDLYVDYKLVLRDLNWELRRGEQWAVYGANGAGKSSFLKLLYGDLSPATGGRIVRRGFPAGTPIDAWKRQIGYVSPELQADYAVDVSVFDLVASGRYASIGLAQALSTQDRAATLERLKFFGLGSLANRRPRELSYGQLRRALIARALAGKARILLLDEPLSGLDPDQRAAMQRLLETLMGRNLSVVIAVHHAEDLPRGMTHGLRLQQRQAYPMLPVP